MELKSKKSAKDENKIEVTESSVAEQTGNENAYETMIAEAAYYLAEQRSFYPGHETEDWLEAEKEIKQAQTAA